MANGYSPTDKKIAGLQPIGASESEVLVGSLGLSAGGSRHLRIDIAVSSVTVTTGITAKLQMAPRGGDTFTDLAGANASVAITGNGVFSLTQAVERAADQANMPLMKNIRVVITTQAGDAVTVDNVLASQEL